MEHRQQFLHHILKFFSVSLAGGAIDAGTGLACFNLLGFSLQASTAAGFSVGLVFGYLAHQNWTFASGKRFDPAAFVTFLLANLFLLAVRLLTVQSLLWVLRHTPFAGDKLFENAIYLAMLGVSFVINYLLCRFLVFRKK